MDESPVPSFSTVFKLIIPSNFFLKFILDTAIPKKRIISEMKNEIKSFS